MSLYLQTIRQFIAQNPPLTPEQAQDLLDKIKPLVTEETLGIAVAEWCSNNGIELLIEPDNTQMTKSRPSIDSITPEERLTKSRPSIGSITPEELSASVRSVREDLINTLNTYEVPSSFLIQKLKDDLINRLNTYLAKDPKEDEKTNDNTQ